ncbi:hypothetical protein BGZ76_005653 [Entomortierella beljakovae]|nr:hypothetical protein BGZ76_005653 [Entomortierella beljakovae]
MSAANKSTFNYGHLSPAGQNNNVMNGNQQPNENNNDGNNGQATIANEPGDESQINHQQEHNNDQQEPNNENSQDATHSDKTKIDIFPVMFTQLKSLTSRASICPLLESTAE